VILDAKSSPLCLLNTGVDGQLRGAASAIRGIRCTHTASRCSLFAGTTHNGAVEFDAADVPVERRAAAGSGQEFDPSRRLRAITLDYGLPSHFFVVVEGLAWFAQACRSGVWIYFEATPPQRQQAMYEALLQFGPEEFARHYQFGMRHWRDAQEVAPLDSWMKAMDEVENEWMRTILRAHRAEYKALYAS
jgi:hypothetical protein